MLLFRGHRAYYVWGDMGIGSPNKNQIELPYFTDISFWILTYCPAYHLNDFNAFYHWLTLLNNSVCPKLTLLSPGIFDIGNGCIIPKIVAT